MRRLLAAAALMLLAGSAAAFPTELTFDDGGLNVEAELISDGRLAIVRVTNGEGFALLCDAVFRNGPEVGRVRRVVVGPASVATLNWTPRRKVVRLRVEASCRPHDPLE
jgi:hypothetical protein